MADNGVTSWSSDTEYVLINGSHFIGSYEDEATALREAEKQAETFIKVEVYKSVAFTVVRR